jgi:DNA repair protein RadC
MNIKLSEEQKIKVLCSDDLYNIMQQVLLREQKIDQNREHFWTVSLDNAHRILNIELISMGSIHSAPVEPMEVFSVPLQKRSVKLMIVHNHPSGELKPSDADKGLTDRLIQVGKIIKLPLLDHLIITDKAYYSFLDHGLMEELEKSLKYVPAYEIKERYEKAAQEIGEKKGQKDKAREMARAMKAEGEPIDKIVKYTGLSEAVVKRLKVD